MVRVNPADATGVLVETTATRGNSSRTPRRRAISGSRPKNSLASRAGTMGRLNGLTVIHWLRSGGRGRRVRGTAELAPPARNGHRNHAAATKAGGDRARPLTIAT